MLTISTIWGAIVMCANIRTTQTHRDIVLYPSSWDIQYVVVNICDKKDRLLFPQKTHPIALHRTKSKRPANANTRIPFCSIGIAYGEIECRGAGKRQTFNVFLKE